MNKQIIQELDEPKGITRIHFYDGHKKSHIGDVSLHTNEFTVCPDLEEPEKVIPKLGKLFARHGSSLSDYSAQSGLLIIDIFVL